MSKIRLATVHNPKTNTLHVDDPYVKYEQVDEVPYGSLLLDLNALGSAVIPNGKAASVTPTRLDNVFYNSEEEGGIMALDIAHDYYDSLRQSKAASSPVLQLEKTKEVIENRKYRDIQSLMNIAASIVYSQRHSKAGAVITSLDYSAFVTTPTLGGNLENRIRTGILAGLFQTVAMPNLSGKWRSESNDLKYYRNLAETQSPEPSKGTGTTTTVTIQKHGGAVAITQRAQAVINDDDPFQRLVAQMGQKRLFDENDMIADEIESNTANTIAGVDFGLRAGTPPLSSTNPVDFFINMSTQSDALSQPFNLFISRGLMFWELAYNDIIRGGATAGNPLLSTGLVNEQVGQFPGVDGMRWARDNAITSTTAGWVMNDNAIKLFRGPSRNYTIADEDIETTKYVTKNYFMPDTMDTSIIYNVTGIAA